MTRSTRMSIAAAGAAAGLLLFCSNPTSTKDEPVVPLSDSVIDSLFDELVTLVQSFDALDTASDYQAGKNAIMSKDFASLRDGFATAPANPKANVGVIVSSILALNTSGRLEMLADSIDAYVRAMELYFDSGGSPCVPKELRQESVGVPVPGLSRVLVDNHGLQGLATSILVRAPAMLKARAQVPSFPSMVTFSYLQDIIRADVMPALTQAIDAAGRLEQAADWEVRFLAGGEPAEVDVSDVLLLDGGMRLLRGVCRMLTAFDMDLYTSASDQTFSWVGDMMHAMECMAFDDVRAYELRGDTLVSIQTVDVSAGPAVMYRVMRYNLEERPAFMTMIENSAGAVEQDLKSSGPKLRSGLAALRAETDDQMDDIVSSLEVFDLDEEMLDIRDELIRQGVSPALAGRFRTPEALIDFLEELHAGPVTFNEVIDSHQINITVDLSVGFRSPTQDLRATLPRYRWRPEDQWPEKFPLGEAYVDSYGVAETHLWIYNDTSDYDLTRLRPYIDSIVVDPYYGDQWTVYLNHPYRYRTHADTMIQAVPLDLLDGSDNAMTPAVIDSLIEAEAFFPYFNDYTMGGVFPDMTRQKWLDLIWQ